MGLQSPDPDFPHTSQILRLASCFARLFSVPESAGRRSDIHETLTVPGYSTPVTYSGLLHRATLGINILHGHQHRLLGASPVRSGVLYVQLD